MSDIKLWENPLFSIEERWVHANAEIFARGQTIAALKEQNALLTVQVQEWWKLVPVEPTKEMWKAGAKRAGIELSQAALCWDAMLDTAPTLPQQVKSEDARDGTQLPGGVSNGLSAQD